MVSSSEDSSPLKEIFIIRNQVSSKSGESVFINVDFGASGSGLAGGSSASGGLRLDASLAFIRLEVSFLLVTSGSATSALFARLLAFSSSGGLSLRGLFLLFFDFFLLGSIHGDRFGLFAIDSEASSHTQQLVFLVSVHHVVVDTGSGGLLTSDSAVVDFGFTGNHFAFLLLENS
jgi:hypothetical protein